MAKDKDAKRKDAGAKDSAKRDGGKNLKKVRNKAAGKKATGKKAAGKKHRKKRDDAAVPADTAVSKHGASMACKVVAEAAHEVVGNAVDIAARNVRASRPATARTVQGAWDLHAHTVFSDGSCTVDELVERARNLGLAGIAITDHDTLAPLSYVRARSRELGFPILAGTEISGIDRQSGRKVHVLAYGLEATSDGTSPVERMVAETLYARTANTLWQAWVLKQRDVEFSGRRISLDDIVRTAGQSTGVYKQHLMESLTKRPRTDPDYKFFYACQLKGSSPANRDIPYPAVQDVVRAVREQGGTPVLAHPGQQHTWELIPELVRAGLLGIEAYHPDHGPVEQTLAFEAAADFGLFVTGGSDFHGKYGLAANMGEAFVMPEEAGEPVRALFERETTLA